MGAILSGGKFQNNRKYRAWIINGKMDYRGT